MVAVYVVKCRASLLRLVLFVLALSATAANAQIVKSCPGGDVRSLEVLQETGADWALGVEPEIIPRRSSTEDKSLLSIVVYGPILASSTDEPQPKVELTCTAKGFQLEATIVRFAEGDVLKNVLWRPAIGLKISAHKPEIVLQVMWRMHGRNGKEIDRAQTPPYPEKKYPITVRQVLRTPAAAN